jgi:hypothetical protein
LAPLSRCTALSGVFRSDVGVLCKDLFDQGTGGERKPAMGRKRHYHTAERAVNGRRGLILKGL